ncbi:MAG: very short patch repair endonuclease [Candidatus Binatia bacterium]
MVDTVTPARRSEIMSRVRQKDTRPELFVRRLLHAAGFRYRLHYPGLPGTPDLVFPARKKVLFIHGCFWHMHNGCSMARIPKSRVEFWTTKLNANRTRDRINILKLREDGWDVLVVWECELKDIDLLAKLTMFLNHHSNIR